MFSGSWSIKCIAVAKVFFYLLPAAEGRDREIVYLCTEELWNLQVISDRLAAPTVVRTPCLSNVGAEILWKTSAEVLV